MSVAASGAGGGTGGGGGGDGFGGGHGGGCGGDRAPTFEPSSEEDEEEDEDEDDSGRHARIYPGSHLAPPPRGGWQIARKMRKHPVAAEHGARMARSQQPSMPLTYVPGGRYSGAKLLPRKTVIRRDARHRPGKTTKHVKKKDMRCKKNFPHPDYWHHRRGMKLPPAVGAPSAAPCDPAPIITAPAPIPPPAAASAPAAVPSAALQQALAGLSAAANHLSAAIGAGNAGVVNPVAVAASNPSANNASANVVGESDSDAGNASSRFGGGRPMIPRPQIGERKNPRGKQYKRK